MASAGAGKRRTALPVAHSAPQRLCTCAGTGTALRRPSFRPLRRFPCRRARRGGGGTAGGLSAPTASLHGSPHPSGLGIFSFAAAPGLTPAVLIRPGISPPRVSFAAAPDISLCARLYFAECRVFRNAAQLPPFASPWPHTRFPSAHVRASPSPTLLRIAAQSLTAVLDVFSCARRGRPFPPCPTTPRRLRTPDSSALRLFSAARPFTPKLV